MMKSKKTNRKFYNKWFYKISLRVEGASGFRVYSPQQLKDICQGNNGSLWVAPHLEKVLESNKELIIKLSSFLENKPIDSWSKRVERKCLDIYTNDEEMFRDLASLFEEETIQRFEPDKEAISQLENNGTIVGKRLPHNKYRYRVYLLPHKLAFDKPAKEKYLSWLKSQSPKITCSSAVENWFLTTNYNWDRRYVLVEDEQTLLMLKLRNSEVVGRVYNYVIADK